MGKEQNLWHLRKLLKEFEHLDSILSDTLKTRNFDILDKIIEAKKEVKRFWKENKK